MSTLYNKRLSYLEEKYVPSGKLDTGRNLTMPDAPSKEHKHFKDYFLQIRNRWKMPGLQVEVAGLPAPKDEKTLDEVCIESEREAMRGMHLAYGVTMYKDEPLRIWFTVRC